MKRTNLFLFTLFIFFSFSFVAKAEQEGVLNIDKKRINKNIQFITVLDIIQDEEITPELKGRITDALNKTQYEFDQYNSYIDKHSRATDNKFIEIDKMI